MNSTDIAVIAGWIARLPLWQRYQLTESRAERTLQAGLQAGDLLLVIDGMRDDGLSDSACGLVWVIRRGAFGRSPYLRLLGVKDGHAGQGLGAALLAHAERIVYEDADHLFLLVSDFNTSAQRFYQRQGYCQVGALPGYVLPDVAELLYWKPLEPLSAHHEGVAFLSEPD